MKPFYVYMLANRRNGRLYLGMTDDLERRAAEQPLGILPGFTEKYGVKTLVWFEEHWSRESALLSD